MIFASPGSGIREPGSAAKFDDRAPRDGSALLRSRVPGPWSRISYPLRMFASFVRWADLDGNNHMANTAFLDACVDARLGFFEQQGFPRSELARLGFGPVVRRDEVDYLRELRLGQKYKVDLQLAGCSEDGSRFILRNTFWLEDGIKVAVVTSHGGWLDLRARRLVAPPEGLLAALNALPRVDDFAELPSSLGSR